MVRWQRLLGEADAGWHVHPECQSDDSRSWRQGEGAHCDFSHVDGVVPGTRIGAGVDAEVPPPPPQAASAHSSDNGNTRWKRSRERRKVAKVFFI